SRVNQLESGRTGKGPPGGAHRVVDPAQGTGKVARAECSRGGVERRRGVPKRPGSAPLPRRAWQEAGRAVGQRNHTHSQDSGTRPDTAREPNPAAGARLPVRASGQPWTAARGQHRAVALQSPPTLTPLAGEG